MNLKPSSFLTLGMIRLGARSGYAIKKAAHVSTQFFWPVSLAQVYPELARLERSGLLRRRDDPHGARRRAAYTLTDEGEQALLAWLCAYAPGATPVQFRDEGLLRLFFADALPAQDQLALVQALRARASRAGAHVREQVVPLSSSLEQGGVRYPALVARLAADTYGYIEDWLAKLEADLLER